MLVAISLDHLGAAAHDVGDDAASGFARKLFDHGGRKPVWIGWKWPLQMDAGDFPVSGDAVFSGRCRAHCAPRAHTISTATKAIQRLDVPQSEALQPRQSEAAAGAG